MVQPALKIDFLSKVENDAMVFSLILQKRGDYVHSREYIKVVLDANNHMLSEVLKIEREIEESSSY